jgi:uncharacterized YigZ family protein
MREKFRTIAGPVRHEIDRIKGSRFIADIAPVGSADEALRQVSDAQSVFHDARHHCWAYRLGNDGEIFRSSDDGEPSGSAGRPILSQIEGHDLTNVVVVVTRYFGGTKLGVGGLVRAYGAATADGLKQAKIRVITVTREFTIDYPYECSGAVQHLIALEGISPLLAEYGTAVRVRIAVPIGRVDEFLIRLRDATSARAIVSP